MKLPKAPKSGIRRYQTKPRLKRPKSSCLMTVTSSFFSIRETTMDTRVATRRRGLTLAPPGAYHGRLRHECTRARTSIKAYEGAARRAEEEEVARRQRAADAAAERAAKEVARQEEIGRRKEARAAAGTPEGDAWGEAERNAARAPSSAAKRKAKQQEDLERRRAAKRAKGQGN
jgi:hypothetical protein